MARLSDWTPISDGWTPIHFAEIVEFLAPLAEKPFAPRPNFDGGDWRDTFVAFGSP